VGEWSVGETAAHVAEVVQENLDVVRGERSAMPDLDVAAANVERLDRYPERDPARVADRIDLLAPQVAAALRAPWGRDVPWHGGLSVSAGAVAAVLLTELLVHGSDIARAEGRAWPVDGNQAALAVDGMTELLPYFVDREAAAGLSACFDVRVRGGARHFLVFEGGTMSVEEPTGRSVDCRISADPAAYLLSGYGRTGQWGPVLRGRMLAWGRRPWLALRLRHLLRTP
jgi:uncharacterized protein (TIGR03083 family)